MPATDFATNIAPADPQIFESQSGDAQMDAAERASDEASKPVTSKPLKGLFFGFAATVTVGLGLASWYVGVRIVAADEVVQSTKPASALLNALPAPTPAAVLPAVQEDSMGKADWRTVPPSYLYLQVAGLGLKQDTDFASSLTGKGFRAQVQMRDGATTRILIGPFSTHAELKQGQRKLQSSGILAVETTY